MMYTTTGTYSHSCFKHNYYIPSGGSCPFCLESKLAPLIKVGWQCPKCTAVMAPLMAACVNCTGDKK